MPCAACGTFLVHMHFVNSGFRNPIKTNPPQFFESHEEIISIGSIKGYINPKTFTTAQLTWQ
jgi:hypothetical protein